MTDTELSTLIANLTIEADTRRRLGGYSADALAILFLTETARTLADEVFTLRKEIRKLKRRR